MALTDWLAADLDPANWEVILSPADVLGARPVSATRVVEAAPNGWAEQTKHALGRTHPVRPAPLTRR